MNKPELLHIELSKLKASPTNPRKTFDDESINELAQSSNLELISREENMRRNTIHHYPEELKEVIRTFSKLNKKINNAKKQINRS